MNVEVAVKEARKIYMRTAYPTTSTDAMAMLDLGPEAMGVVVRIAELWGEQK